MDKQNKMFELISQWKVSALSKSTFCNLHQISIDKLNYWLKKFPNDDVSGSDSSEINFFSVEEEVKPSVKLSKSAIKPAIVVDLPNGVKISFYSC